MTRSITERVHDEIVEEYRRRTPTSKKLMDEACTYMPGGDTRLANSCRLASNFSLVSIDPVIQ